MITSVMMVNSIVIITVNMLLLLSISVFIIIITGSISIVTINIVTNHWIMSCRCQVTNNYLVSYWPLIPNLIIILTNHCHSPWSFAIIVWLFGSNNM